MKYLATHAYKVLVLAALCLVTLSSSYATIESSVIIKIVNNIILKSKNSQLY